MKAIRIATRRSNLAVRQSQSVADDLCARHAGLEAQLVTMTTRGDRHPGPLAAVGGKGLFTRELEAALRERRVHLAIHSAKDLPAAMDAEFAIVAVPGRADPRDALVSRAGDLASLRPGAVVGTGSARRRAQVLSLRPDLRVVGVRGNVETRLQKAVGEGGEMDAVVLAMAGLIRAGLAETHAERIHPLDAEQFVPAAGQGLLAVQAMSADAAVAEVAARLDDGPSRQALEAERAVLRGLEAGCQSCLAIHVAPAGKRWRGWAMVARPDGGGMIRLDETGAAASEVAAALLQSLDERGARELLAAE